LLISLLLSFCTTGAPGGRLLFTLLRLLFDLVIDTAGFTIGISMAGVALQSSTCQHRAGVKLLRRQTVFDSILSFNNMLDC
jgi:hypothetical protein